MKEALLDQADDCTSPGEYSDNERTRSQSPAHSFYHDDSPAPKPVLALPRGRDFTPQFPLANANTTFSEEVFPDPVYTTGCATYKYTPLCGNEIRLLRITPDLFDGPLQCSLKVVSMEKITAKVHEFQALSYAWGNDAPSYNVLLSDLPKVSDGSSTAPTQHLTYPIRKNLYQALKHIRLTDDYLWLWVDYLCIEQTNQEEKSQQIPKMPSIYSSAWNVIAWLGVDDMSGNVEEAVRLIPSILNLKKLDLDLRGELQVKDIFCYHSWIAFGQILQRPWFRRRWVIQEVACARRLSVRIADKILSWLDFADAVDLYSDHFEQMRARHRNSGFYKEGRSQFDDIHISEAVELMRFSRIVFQRSPDSTIASKLMSLESLVLTASFFAVSEVRDTVYALLYLANDMHNVIDTSSESRSQFILTPDYSKHPIDIFKEFVRYSIAKSNSLDVLYRRWASWTMSTARNPSHERRLPSWIGLALTGTDGSSSGSRICTDSFLGPVGSSEYHASHGVNFQGQLVRSTNDDVIQIDGMLLGTVTTISFAHVPGGTIKADWLRMLGWRGTLDEGIEDQLWRTLVANRDPDSRVAPTWYRRACALALTQLDGFGNLNLKDLLADASQPGTLVSYLKRVQEATDRRYLFRCERSDMSVSPISVQNKTSEAVVGLGPKRMDEPDGNQE
ncbi:hypothetical protein J4E91_006088 [Alternaria rosae]|nr:hypothetical protein J4E91_006088 [Alternaria rosae]